MDAVGALLCGQTAPAGIAKTALDQLRKSISKFSAKSIEFLKADISDDALTFGPFCARVLLENSCAALVGRLDPFRMLYLSEFQAQEEYEHGRRARSAFSWNGDVMPDEKGAQKLWSVDHEPPKISRALFSQYSDHVYWRPAVELMLDFASSKSAEPLLSDVLDIDAEKYVSETKGRSAQVYSTLSKGVHWEFFTSALVFDEDTVKNAIRDTSLLVGHLGLASHFIPTACASLNQDQALEAYLSFRAALS